MISHMRHGNIILPQGRPGSSFIPPSSGADCTDSLLLLFALMDRKEKLKFYHSTAWKHMAPRIMRRDHYECQECRKRIQNAADSGILLPAKDRKISRATQVHHIIAYELRPDLGLDPDNLEAICDRCHNIIHGRVWHGPVTRKKYATEEKW